MGSKVLRPSDKMPPGAIKCHLGLIENTYKPRGSLKKNSLSAQLLERLESDQQFWTDESYGDSLEGHVAAERLVIGLRAEVEIAIEEFTRRIFG